MPMSERMNRPEGIRDEVWQTLLEAENALAGRTAETIPDSEGEAEFSGTVLDENQVSEPERLAVMEWLRSIMGANLDELTTRLTLVSPDGLTRVVVYDKTVGEMEYFLSKWINEGERAAYVLWPWEMYEGQLEAGFEEEEK